MVTINFMFQQLSKGIAVDALHENGVLPCSNYYASKDALATRRMLSSRLMLSSRFIKEMTMNNELSKYSSPRSEFRVLLHKVAFSF